MASYESVLSALNAVLQEGRVQLDRHVSSARQHHSSDGSGLTAATATATAAAHRLPNPDLLPRYRAVAYGSFVSGLCSPHGDIDVAVELDERQQQPSLPFSPQVRSSVTL